MDDQFIAFRIYFIFYSSIILPLRIVSINSAKASSCKPSQALIVELQSSRNSALLPGFLDLKGISKGCDEPK